MMGKYKSQGKKSQTYAVGGKTKMHSNTSSGPQKPGQSAQEGRSSAKFAEGGRTPMFGKQMASQCKPA